MNYVVSPRWGKGIPGYKTRTERGPHYDPRPVRRTVTVGLPAGSKVTVVGFNTGYEGHVGQWAVVRTPDGDELTVASSELKPVE
jgi:hypothetical protein